MGSGKITVRVLLGRDLGQRLQVAQLDGDRRLLHDERGIVQLLRRLELALGVDDLRPLLAFRLRLPGHRALHRLRQFDILQFDDAHLDAPRLGLLVDDRLQALVDRLAVGQQLVEFDLADHVAQGRLRDLRGGADDNRRSARWRAAGRGRGNR